MPVVAGDEVVGLVEEVILRPGSQDVDRLVMRSTSPDRRRVALPAEWVSHVDEQGRGVLRVDPEELADLPGYVPTVPSHMLREQVQQALDEHPAIAGTGVSVVEQDGALELRGTVNNADQRTAASEIARSVPGVGPVVNLLGTRTDTGQQAAAPVSAVGYGAAWLLQFLNRATGLTFDEAQAGQIANLAERKLVDLFDVAEEAAIANGRARILLHDLPLTKGLRALLREMDALSREVELGPLLRFLADAGVRAPIDELVRSELPRLMAAILLLAGRIIALLEPEYVGPQERLERLIRPPPGRPTHWEIERATRVLDLTL
jgi:hypothetical protein